MTLNLKERLQSLSTVQHLRADHQFRSLVDEGWRTAPMNLDQLQQLPEGSLGRVYADQLIRHGITPDTLIDPSPVTNAQEFVLHRLKETHDIVHVLTGFGIDAHGFQMGLDADLVIARKLEDGWERPLQEWRRDLKLPSAPGEDSLQS